jgi:hypothetical protein
MQIAIIISMFNEIFDILHLLVSWFDTKEGVPSLYSKNDGWKRISKGSEDKVVIELMRPNQEKQSIPFTLDGI